MAKAAKRRSRTKSRPRAREFTCEEGEDANKSARVPASHNLCALEDICSVPSVGTDRSLRKINTDTNSHTLCPITCVRRGTLAGVPHLHENAPP